MQSNLTTLIGLTPESISGAVGSSKLLITFTNGTTALFYHEQDCCEYVYIDDIVGDLDTLIGHPLTIAAIKQSDSTDKPSSSECQDDSFTWTFITLATIKGYVDIKFYGESNGYYSESVDVTITTDADTFGLDAYDNYERLS